MICTKCEMDGKHIEGCPQPANIYFALMRGWSDGAGVKEMRAEFTEHTDKQLSYYYQESYTLGREARNLWGKHAAEVSGYTPRILRGMFQEKPDEIEN